MSSPRIRRLQSDYDRVVTRFTDWPLVRIEMAEGIPPDLYRIWYNIRGLFTSPKGEIVERDEHVLEIKLGLEYPRRAPQLRLLTPLFHPNFSQTEVCAQDIYAASEGLDDLIVRIGQMIAYQVYNTKSPLNGIAARWAAENSGKLPVDTRDIAPPTGNSQAIGSPPPLPSEAGISPEAEAWTSEIVIRDEDVSTTADNPAAAAEFEFDCPECAARLMSDIANAGAVLECPKCQQEIRVPEPQRDAPPPGADSVEFCCPHCGEDLQSTADLGGAEVQCPRCQGMLVVPLKSE